MHTQEIFPLIEAGDVDGVTRLLNDDPGLAHARRLEREEDGSLSRGCCWMSLLGAAAKAGNLDIVKLLIAHGAEIYENAQWGYPAIEHALWATQQHIVDYFLGEAAAHETMQGAPTYGLGCDINLAARNGWLDIVHRHIEKNPLAVHSRGVIGETPMHWAAHNGHLEVVRALLNAGADIEANEIGLYGGKPLHWAAEHEPPLVELLLSRGAQVDSRNLRNGYTPLIMCARQPNDCAECAELLLAAGADPQARDFQDKTALDYAREGNRMRVIAVLKQN